MTKPKHEAGKKHFPLLKMALGAALAAGAGYYFTHKEDVDREAKKKIEELAELFRETRTEVETRVRKVWGEVNKEAVATYMDLRSQLVKELEAENLKKRGKMLKEQYDKVVDDVVRRARKADLLTPEVEARLTHLFKMDWEDIKKMLMDLMVAGAEKTAKAVKKMQKKGTAKMGAALKRTVKPVKKTAKKAAGKSPRKK